MIDRRERSRSRQKQQDLSKLYVEVFNIPEHQNKDDIVYFLWKTLEKCHALKKRTNPITNSQYIKDLNCIRLFFRSREETLNCLDLNGIYYGTKAFYLKSPLSMRQLPQIDLKDITIRRLNHRVEDSFNKLCLQNIPVMQEFQIVNLLGEVGELKSFQPIYSGKILSHCFFQYKTNQQTQEAINKLDNQKVRGKQISVKRAALTNSEASKRTITKVKPKSNFFQKDLQSFYLTFDTIGFFKSMKISCVLLLKNIISSQSQRQFIKNDIRSQVQKIGTITKLVAKDKNIYIEYQRVEYAQICYLILMNRKFDGKGFDVSFYDPLNFADDILI